MHLQLCYSNFLFAILTFGRKIQTVSSLSFCKTIIIHLSVDRKDTWDKRVNTSCLRTQKGLLPVAKVGFSHTTDYTPRKFTKVSLCTSQIEEHPSPLPWTFDLRLAPYSGDSIWHEPRPAWSGIWLSIKRWSAVISLRILSSIHLSRICTGHCSHSSSVL